MTQISFTLLNGVQFSMLIFVMAVGLTLIFGLMNTLNLAHGAFYTIGAYSGYLVAKTTGSFWVALAVAPVLPFVIGFVLQMLILQPLTERGRSPHLDLALVTFGFLFAASGAIELILGPAFNNLPVPPSLQGTVTLFGLSYPIYRIFVVFVGLITAAVVHLTLSQTLIGAAVRAGVDNREMVIAMGINVRLLFSLVFASGCALAGLAGVIAAPIFSVYSQMGVAIVAITFVVVVTGGLGNVAGSFYAALLVGIFSTFVQTYLPKFELFAVPLLLISILSIRPTGLFSRERRSL